ncbi:hypothetical protein, partial [Mesorhizobium sp. M0571]|uniref:hypothetical protein n=1 Tax=Mesorhizobium sp. M0571 TaxID=2956960 RepID=UPI00333BD07F
RLTRRPYRPLHVPMSWRENSMFIGLLQGALAHRLHLSEAGDLLVFAGDRHRGSTDQRFRWCSHMSWLNNTISARCAIGALVFIEPWDGLI